MCAFWFSLLRKDKVKLKKYLEMDNQAGQRYGGASTLRTKEEPFNMEKRKLRVNRPEVYKFMNAERLNCSLCLLLQETRGHQMFLEGLRSKPTKGNHTPCMRYLSYALPCHSVLWMLKINMSLKED